MCIDRYRRETSSHTGSGEAVNLTQKERRNFQRKCHGAAADGRNQGGWRGGRARAGRGIH